MPQGILESQQSVSGLSRDPSHLQVLYSAAQSAAQREASEKLTLFLHPASLSLPVPCMSSVTYVTGHRLSSWDVLNSNNKAKSEWKANAEPVTFKHKLTNEELLIQRAKYSAFLRSQSASHSGEYFHIALRCHKN